MTTTIHAPDGSIEAVLNCALLDVDDFELLDAGAQRRYLARSRGYVKHGSGLLQVEICSDLASAQRARATGAVEADDLPEPEEEE